MGRVWLAGRKLEDIAEGTLAIWSNDGNGGFMPLHNVGGGLQPRSLRFLGTTL